MSQQRHRTPKSVVAKARRLLMEGRVEEAVDALQEVASYNNAQELLKQVRHRVLHDLTAQHIETAREALDQGQIVPAETILNQILELDPNHQGALGLLQELSELRPAEVPWDEALGAATSPPVKNIEADRVLLDRVDALLVTEPKPTFEAPKPPPPASSHEHQRKAAAEPFNDSKSTQNPTAVTPLEPPKLASPRSETTEARAAEPPQKPKVTSAPVDPQNPAPAPVAERSERRPSGLGFAPVLNDTGRGPSYLDDMARDEPGLDEISIRSTSTIADPVAPSVAATAQPPQNAWLPRVAIALAALALVLVLILALQFWNPVKPVPAAEPQIPEPREARVIVSAAEVGLEIWKDGEDLGLRTPATLSFKGVLGEQVRVELRRDGKNVAQERWTIGVDVPPSWEPDIAPPLPKSEPLEILSVPPGARVVLDKTEVGVTPTTIQLLATQTHTLELHLDGHETETRDLAWENLTGVQRNAREFTVRLQAKTGRVVVSASYPVRLYVDRVDHGVVKTLELKPGDYQISAVAPEVFYFGRHRESSTGKQGVQLDVQIEAGKDFLLPLPKVVYVQLIPEPSNCVIWIDQERVTQKRMRNLLPITVGRHHFRFFWPDEERNKTFIIEVEPTTRIISRTSR